MNVLYDASLGREVLYIDGYLQFDAADEALYHESLALPALCLAGQTKRVLICGGGDGLALREVLRFPGVTEVDLVDFSSEVLDLGRTELAELNCHAFEDPRVTVHLANALDFVAEAKPYDVIVCDFTFPTSPEEARLFNREWYEQLNRLLLPGGTIALNAVSPQTTPEAFACLVRTVRAAGLSTVPYRVCIPSFRDQGYGAWGFLLASPRHVSKQEFHDLRCPVSTRQADLRRLWRGSKFSRAELNAFRTAPIHSEVSPCLLECLAPKQGPLIDGLLAEIAPQHAYHTRQMVQELAEQVCGSIRTLDLRKLVEELWKRVHLLPERLQQELARIREFIGERLFRTQDYAEWTSRIFAALLIVMTLANTLAPDNAFGKGAVGLGHSSFSRGFEGEGSMHGSFAMGGAFGSRAPVAEPMALRGSGFRSSYGRDPVDVYGQPYPMQRFYYRGFGGGYGGGYYGGGYGGNYGGSYGGGNAQQGGNQQNPQNQQDEHQPLFVADDDLIVMDNGDAVITLSPDAYIVVSGGQLHLMSKDQPTPLTDLYADPALLQNIRMQIADQSATVSLEIANRREWLAWVGWTDSMFPTIRSEQTELRNLRSLSAKLTLCYQRVGEPKEDARAAIPADAVEIFVGCYLMKDGSVTLYDPTGKPQTLDPETLVKQQPQLAKTLTSVIAKLTSEIQADIAQNDKDLAQATADYASDQNDYQQYTQILQSNYNDNSYEVDYGTDSISVGSAIQKTQDDMDAIKSDALQTQKERDSNADQVQRLAALSQRLLP